MVFIANTPHICFHHHLDQLSNGSGRFPPQFGFCFAWITKKDIHFCGTQMSGGRPDKLLIIKVKGGEGEPAEVAEG